MDFKRLRWSEFLGFGGAAVLVLSLWLPWFSTPCELEGNDLIPEGCNDSAYIVIGGGEKAYGHVSAWDTFVTLDWLLVAACAAPFILSYIILRGHELTWRPGEVTMIVGMVAVALILLNGIILGKPDKRPEGSDTRPAANELSLDYGYAVALLGGGLIAVSGLIRQAQGAKDRKPPGVL